MSRALHLNGAILDGALADFSAYVKLSLPVNTADDSAARRDYVNAQVLEQKSRIDAMLSGAGINLDNLKEIADYVNTLDSTQQTDILAKVATLNATITANREASELRDANLRSDLEAEAAARALAVTTEQTRATAAEQLVQSNFQALSVLELKHYNQQTYLTEVEQRVRNVASVYADGSPALVPDTSLLTEQGWFYKKSAAVGNKKHNWYMPVPEGLKVKHLKSISLYAKMQTTSPLQSVGELPFFGIYTARLGDGKDRASWYRSRVSWSPDFISGDYQGKKVMRVKLDATREHINNGDYAPVEYALGFNNLYSTGSSSLADVGEEAVSLLHISSNSGALAHQEYFVHSLKLQLEAHTHNYILDGANVDLEKRVADVQSNLNTGKAALEAADSTEAAARLAADSAETAARIAADQAEASARVDAIQQEAAARTVAIEAEANARAIKDGEHDAALAAESAARIADVTSEASARQSADNTERTVRFDADTAETAARLAADEAETTARLSADALELNARVAADDAIIVTQNNHKEAADLTAERLAQLYLYFNQTYESVVAHNQPPPAIQYNVTDQYFHNYEVYQTSAEDNLKHLIYCVFTTRNLAPANDITYGYKISYALASNQSVEYVVGNDVPANGGAQNIPIGSLPDARLQPNTTYVAIVTLINRVTKEELTNLQPKQLFSYTAPDRIVVDPRNNQTIRIIGTEQEINAASLTPNENGLPYFYQASPRGFQEWFAVINQSHLNALKDYIGQHPVPTEVGGLTGQVASYPFFHPPGESSPVNINNIIITLMSDLSNLFWGRLRFNNSLSSWDTSRVTNMSGMFGFQGQSDGPRYGFNHPSIQYWNVSNVENFQGMFNTNYAFDQNVLNGWLVNSAINMEAMFQESRISDDLSSWTTNSVTNMHKMFRNAWYFNRDISMWNVNNVTNWEAFKQNSALTLEQIPLKFRDGQAL
jgi:hypothetical protein